MSVDLVKWAIKQQISPTQKLVLMVLAEHGNEHEKCWPGRELLATETGLGTRSVSGAIKVLRGLGLISVERRTFAAGGSTSNRYVFNTDVAIVAVRDDLMEDVKDTYPDSTGCAPDAHPVESGCAPDAPSGCARGAPPFKEEPQVLTIRSAHEHARDASVIFDPERNSFQVAPDLLDSWIERYRRVVDREHWSPDLAEEWVRHQVRSAAVYLSDPAKRKKYRDLKRFLENQLSRAGERLIVPHARYAKRNQHRAAA